MSHRRTVALVTLVLAFASVARAGGQPVSGGIPVEKLFPGATFAHGIPSQADAGRSLSALSEALA